MLNEIINIIKKHVRNKDMNITEGMSLARELEINSYDLVELVCDIEDFFSIEIPDSKIRTFIKVKDLITYIEANV